MNRLAIVGSNGYVGKNLKAGLEGLHYVVPFSHSSTLDYEGKGLGLNRHYSLTSLIKFTNSFDVIIFLLESKNLKDRNFIKEYLLDLLNSTHKAKVIIFSSVSVYGNLKSQYVEFKLGIEEMAISYQNVIILRPGVIFGGIPGGLYKTFLGFKSKKLILLPSGDAVTGYVDIKNIIQRVQDILSLKVKDKVQTLIDMPLSLSDAIRFFGFRGLILAVPAQFVLSVFSPFTALMRYFPVSIQSILTLSSISLPPFQKSLLKNTIIFRRILLTQFIGLNASIDLKFSIRGFIREIENNNSLFEYFNMSINQRFIFFKRLSEIYNLSLIK